MKSKKNPSVLKAVGMREDRGLMYYTGKKLKGKKLKQFKQDMLGLTSMKYLNKHL